MRDKAKKVAEIRARLADYGDRQRLRVEARNTLVRHKLLFDAVQQGMVVNLEQAIEVCGWIKARYKEVPGTFGTKELHVDTGDVLIFGPDGTLICRASRSYVRPVDFWEKK